MVLKGGWRAKVEITKQTKTCREIQGDAGRDPKRVAKETEMPENIL